MTKSKRWVVEVKTTQTAHTRHVRASSLADAYWGAEDLIAELTEHGFVLKSVTIRPADAEVAP